MSTTIREELAGDREGIRTVNLLAFGQEEEANLVDLLRANGKMILSLVAVDGDSIVGHILYSAVTLFGSRSTVRAVGLGPMAVLPVVQRRGIGTKLVHKSLRKLQDGGRNFVIVLGHPDYYPRFRFRRASEFSVRWELECPDEAFMLLELMPGTVPPGGGIIQYEPEFSGV